MKKKKLFNKVSVVMISRNEAKSVRKVITDIKHYVPGAEILLVDSSTDETAKLAMELGARVVRQFPPRGYGPAMERALLSAKGEIIVTVDCDNSYPVDVIPTLIKRINEGYDVVGTSRLSFGKPEHMPSLNYVANKFFNYLATLIFLRIIYDIHTGMRAYKKGLLHKINWGVKGYVIPGLSRFKSGKRGNAFPVELLLKPISLGYRYIELPIKYNERLGASKLEKWNSMVWTMIRIINSRLTR